MVYVTQRHVLIKPSQFHLCSALYKKLIAKKRRPLIISCCGKQKCRDQFTKGFNSKNHSSVYDGKRKRLTTKITTKDEKNNPIVNIVANVYGLELNFSW